MSASTGVESQVPETVTASISVAVPVAHVWEVLVSPAGAQALLGEGAVLGTKGEPYHCTDGSYGVVRSYHPLEQLRVSWHTGPDTPATVVEVGLRADGDSTALELSQSQLHAGLDRTALGQRWTQGLAALEAAAFRGA